jgi:hypothetical protein
MPGTLRKLFLLLGLILLVALVVNLGAGRILAMLLDVGWGFAVVALLYAGHQLVRAAALGRCVLREHAFSYADLVWIRIAGESVQYLTFTGPFLAEPTKALLLKRRGLTTEEGFAASLTEYLIYTLLSAALSVGAMAYLLARFTLSPALTAAALLVLGVMGTFLASAAVAILFRIYLIGGIIRLVARLPLVQRRWRIDHAGVRRMEDLLLVVLRERPARLLGVAGLGLLAHALLVVELYWLMRTVNLSFPGGYPLLIEAAGKFVTFAFFFIPGRLGAAEGSFALIFAAVGLPAAAGFSVSFARRVRSLLMAGAGALALSLLTKTARAD